MSIELLVGLAFWAVAIILPTVIVVYRAYKADTAFGKLMRRRKVFYLIMIAPMYLLVLSAAIASLLLKHDGQVAFMDVIGKYGVPTAVLGLFVCYGSLIYDLGRARGMAQGSQR